MKLRTQESMVKKIEQPVAGWAAQIEVYFQ